GSPALAAFLAHVEVAVAVHGYGRRGMWTSLLLGGTNRALAAHLADHLAPVLPGYELVTDLDAMPDGLRGVHPRNPVNLPSAGGVQLELPPRVRGRAPTSPPPGPDGLSPPTAALIDGLAAAARAWNPRRTDATPPPGGAQPSR
ncbi:MAG TPA: poly-gamma-glutamate hydrolase family protein, partial [Aquihabitans sp.]|nr:poly-gamma-glutamate hydrolase family protein [Aquihabitans sp.]